MAEKRLGVDNATLEQAERRMRRSSVELETQAAAAAAELDAELLRLRLIEAEYRGFRIAVELLTRGVA